MFASFFCRLTRKFPAPVSLNRVSDRTTVVTGRGVSDSSGLDALGALAEPTRRRLYEFVAQSGRRVGRDEAAQGAGIGRSLAAYHLDKLVEHGLLEVDYARPPGRSG